MFDSAALVLEEIAPEDKNRNEVLGARVNLYMAAKKWDMAEAVASHLVKVQPENAGSSSPRLKSSIILEGQKQPRGL
jgi:lipopolysaccharide biosynthesis regulator YciM